MGHNNNNKNQINKYKKRKTLTKEFLGHTNLIYVEAVR
jgi:hypothetical protein